MAEPVNLRRNGCGLLAFEFFQGDIEPLTFVRVHPPTHAAHRRLQIAPCRAGRALCRSAPGVPSRRDRSRPSSGVPPTRRPFPGSSPFADQVTGLRRQPSGPALDQAKASAALPSTRASAVRTSAHPARVGRGISDEVAPDLRGVFTSAVLFGGNAEIVTCAHGGAIECDRAREGSLGFRRHSRHWPAPSGPHRDWPGRSALSPRNCKALRHAFTESE